MQMGVIKALVCKGKHPLKEYVLEYTGGYISLGCGINPFKI